MMNSAFFVALWYVTFAVILPIAFMAMIMILHVWGFLLICLIVYLCVEFAERMARRRGVRL